MDGEFPALRRADCMSSGCGSTPPPSGKDFSVSRGDLMSTASSSYWVEGFLGEGAYGKVARCLKTATNERVAVKIIKNHPVLIRTAIKEIAILRQLQVLDPDRCGIVRWMGAFVHCPHICLEFELLAKSLLDVTEQAERHTLPLMQIKIILEQVELDFNLNNIQHDV
ncbi:Homeodomain-interacting protein kinase 3 [Merluccius polli]|uniref:Homeodomain-interacting protein kinase 3 n=1 Tax=Merluccius polli TaxID=89951 RepID=A0AA47MB89_MERPO|nr:Homeodomain-interacting protein kinase 3 [Merluccius polli]KAK0137083.1 Homeodomain-interacting protein kinase 3 [Merluccius polli]KAK0144277.1 Homeodomain-interacting protein kinase 3 [Merluccius polli]